MSQDKTASRNSARWHDAQADRIVPPSGFTVTLTTFGAAAIAFIAVFAFALALAAGRLAARWESELANTSTLRISAPKIQLDAQTDAALNVLRTTSGVKSFRVLDEAEQKTLLEPWFGPDFPVDRLALPRLIEIIEEPDGFDANGLQLRLAAEVPGALLDDHTRWRRPLVQAAGNLRLLGAIASILILLVLAAIVSLAAQAALAANAQVIVVLRLVGAQDYYIARAFTRRFALRAFVGAAFGVAFASLTLFLSPQTETPILTGLSFEGVGWLLPWVLPPASAAIAFVTTKFVARRKLEALA